MSFDKIQCVVVNCDVCGDDFEPGDYLVHYGREDDTLDMLETCGWNVDGNNVWCDHCLPPCICGHHFGSHDYG
ncbi:hypothetical protein LCGC14_2336990, partial [marine sediment metagenome]